MKKKLIFAASVFFLGIAVFASFFYWKNLRGLGPAIKDAPIDIAEVLNETGFPLKLPEGFSISIFADNLPGARAMVFDGFGNMWVSQTSENSISLLEISDGGVVNRGTILEDVLSKPHGLAVDPERPTLLYVAEENKISAIPLYSEPAVRKIADLSTGGRHSTRTLGFGPDGRLYVSIGSSCNVCNESDNQRAKIFSMRKDGSDFSEFARGLRNAVFFTWHPKTGEMWATEMGRDLLGDDIPPDEINIVREGGNYGWPICFGKNIHDTDFDKNTYIRNPCMEPFETPSFIDIQAHSAPLGLAFVPENSNWPEEYWNNLLVAFHGSWNRSVPTGYKIYRYKLDGRGNYLGEKDFISGWLRGTEAIGRPAGLLFGADGALYVSDDKAGVIYKITPPR